MIMSHEVPEQHIRLPDKAIAALLGISLDEYLALSHKPLQEFRDMSGRIIEFYMHVSPNNDQKVLNKLKIDHSNFVRFRPEEVYRFYA